MSQEFTHLDSSGNPSMVNVGQKSVTERMARAQSIVVLNAQILELFEHDDIRTPKGSVFQTAIIAGVMAAKKTGELIPLCHPIGLEDCQINIQLNAKQEVVIECKVHVAAKTGVEMEALTGASIAALTIYDMCKAFSHDIEIKSTQLIEKKGGKRDFKRD